MCPPVAGGLTSAEEGRSTAPGGTLAEQDPRRKHGPATKLAAPMIRAGVGLSTQRTRGARPTRPWRRRWRRACEPDAALLLATPDHGAGMASLLAAAGDALGTRTVVGATRPRGDRIGPGARGRPRAVAVLAIEGLEAARLPARGRPAATSRRAAEEIAARLGGAPRPEDLVVLLPDPRAVHLHALLGAARDRLWLRRRSSERAPRPLDASAPLQWCGREVDDGRASRVSCCAARASPRVGVTQACRPGVRAADGHARPGPLDPRARRAPRARRLPRGRARPAGRGPAPRGGLRARRAAARRRDARSRPAATWSATSRASRWRSALWRSPRRSRSATSIAFVQRDPATAREDLKAMLAQLRERAAGLRPLLRLLRARRVVLRRAGPRGRLPRAELRQRAAGRACSARARSDRSPAAPSC